MAGSGGLVVRDRSRRRVVPSAGAADARPRWPRWSSSWGNRPARGRCATYWLVPWAIRTLRSPIRWMIRRAWSMPRERSWNRRGMGVAVVTPLARHGRTVAQLIHRPGLLDDRAVKEVVAATRLALESERLQAEVLAQLEDLRSLTGPHCRRPPTQNGDDSSATSTTEPSSASSESHSRSGSLAPGSATIRVRASWRSWTERTRGSGSPSTSSENWRTASTRRS